MAGRWRTRKDAGRRPGKGDPASPRRSAPTKLGRAATYGSGQGMPVILANTDRLGPPEGARLFARAGVIAQARKERRSHL